MLPSLSVIYTEFSC